MIVLRSRDRGPDQGRGPVSTDITIGPTVWTDGYLSKCRRCSRMTPRRTIAAARDLFARAGSPNLMIKISGTTEGLRAIEDSIFAGIRINVTLLFSREHYLAAAEAFVRGIERGDRCRPEAGRRLGRVGVRQRLGLCGRLPLFPSALRNKLGIADRRPHLQGVPLAPQLAYAGPGAGCKHRRNQREDLAVRRDDTARIPDRPEAAPRQSA